MNTELILCASSGSVFLSSGIVDMYDDVPVSLNYNIADIRTPEKRNSDYSKTILCPGTSNNHNLFGHIFEIGTDRLFDPNKKTEARILINKTQIMKGFLRLKKINSLRDKKIEYEFEFKGRLDDLFSNMADSELTDLTWTDLDHVWNKTNIINSWTAAIGSNYMYPTEARGEYGVDWYTDRHAVDRMFPATYVKEIFDRIFSYAGFQYTSTFLTGNFFKRLVIPCNKKELRLTDAQIGTRKFRSSRLTTDFVYTFTQTFPEVFTEQFNNDSTAPNEDTGNNYDAVTTFTYTAPSTGTYTFETSCIVQFNTVSTYGDVRILKNGLVVANSNPLLAPNSININQTLYASYTAFLNAGDLIKVEGRFTNVQVGGGRTITLKTGSYFLANPSAVMTAGETITYSSVLPEKVKMKDFILSIIKAFNLYFEYDKDTPNKLLIEPRNDYYLTTVQDWSNKLDASQNVVIEPMGALDAKEYLFAYKEDKDYMNQVYQKSYQGSREPTYGARTKIIDNDFLKGQNKLDVIFSPTPSISIADRFEALYQGEDRKLVATNIRMLYYAGVKTCNSWDFYNAAVTWDAGTITSRTDYAHVGHIDDTSAPDIDLSFGVPREVYYNPPFGATYTNNNLYNVYWKTFIEEITDKNSSIVTAWFNLNEVDISLVNFRHIYRFNNQNFRLNKIYDFNPITPTLTKCEFIKTKTTRPFGKTSVSASGGRSSTALGLAFDTGEIAPELKTMQPTVMERGNINLGDNNIIADSAKNIMVIGFNNTVGEKCVNISVLQSSGCVVAGGLVNVSIEHSSGITVTEDNTKVERNVTVYSPSSGSVYGTYIPTIVSSTNTTGTPTVERAQWMRVGSIVTVSGVISSIDPTLASTTTSITLSLPIGSAMTAYELSGTATFGNSPDVGRVAGTCIGTGGNNNVAILFYPTNGDVYSGTYIYTYEVI